MRWLTEMVVYAKVVEAGGFAPAARLLGLTRSAVSKHVGRLEEGLGVRLLHRTTRAMSLTDAGRSVYEQCVRLATAAEEAVAAAGRLSSVPRGWLKVSASVAFGHAVLVPGLPNLLARYPELRVDLALLDRNVDLAEEGYDLVLRFTDRPPEGLAARRLAEVHFVLCASPDYLARHGTPETTAGLAGHNCVRQGHPQAATEWLFDGPHGSDKVRVDGNAVVSGSEAVRELLLAGLGCGSLPDFMVAADIAAGRLVRLLPEHTPHGRFASLYALYLPSRQGNPKVRAFIDWLLETLERS
ncbi:MAG: LysR family transcriptional regulator [Gallionellaceae bacterium]|nr:LysR family transcriptional regulator [Gallionellaceae bacterium]